MKYLALIPLVFVASCASRPQVTVLPSAAQPVKPVESVRYGEVVRAYHIGRHADPNHPDTIEEEHPVYRIEVTARWNLHPGSSEAVNLLNPPPDAAYAPSPVSDAVVAEINRQRENTASVIHQANRLAQSYNELQQIFTEMKKVARDNVAVSTRLASMEKRIAGFEKELDRSSATSLSPTNDASAFPPESSATKP